MTNLDPYISRKAAEKLLDNFGRALKQPQEEPLVFYVYGIGGVGKSTLLDKLRETYAKEAKFARAFFGSTSKIDSPLALMEHLYKQLPDDGWGGDGFVELCQKYKETLNKLETELPEGRGSASPEPISLVKKLLSGAVKAFASWNMPDNMAEQLGSAAEGVVDVASQALSEKDRLDQLLKKHQATKNKRELQELMLGPLPKLTQAFAAGVNQPNPAASGRGMEESGFARKPKACIANLQASTQSVGESDPYSIEYAPHRCRREAKHNPDFDRLQGDEQFQALIKV